MSNCALPTSGSLKRTRWPGTLTPRRSRADKPRMSAVMDTGAVSKIEMQEWGGPEAWMVGASTRLVDCWAPQTECIRMPALRWPVSVVEMRAGRGRLPVSSCGSRRRRGAQSRHSVELDDHTVAIDLRPSAAGTSLTP